jgi:hypothetical protein
MKIRERAAIVLIAGLLFLALMIALMLIYVGLHGGI